MSRATWNSFGSLLLLLLLPLSAVPSQAQREEESPIAAAVGIDLLSDYVFRGLNYYEGFSVQPSLFGSYQLDKVGEFSGSIWAHLPGEGDSSHKSFYEINYSAAYAVQTGPFVFSAGHKWYSFHQTAEDSPLESTRELFGGFVFDALLTPSFMLNYDYDNREGQYYELSFSERLESGSWGENVSVLPYVALGMAHRSSQYSQGGVVQVTYGVSTDIEFNGIVLSPGVAISLSRDARTRDDFWFGLRSRWQW